jgi:regulator of sirC expression with transglutaminase-like and TPR domain
VRNPFAGDPEFGRLVRGDECVHLVDVALEIARDAYPDLDRDHYRRRIDELGDRAGARCPPDCSERTRIGHINWVMFVEEGFRGNTEDYYDPRNSYLNEVIDRKVGLPIALSVLYAEVAARAGLALGCANLPMHFMLRVMGYGYDDAIFVDPFHEGRILDFDGCEAFLSKLAGRTIRLGVEESLSCDPSVTVARMLRNLKAVDLDQKDYAAALPVVRRLAALRRDDLDEQRDWGMVCLQADRPGEALGPLGRYVELMPEAPDLEIVRSLLKSARREVALRN